MTTETNNSTPAPMFKSLDDVPARRVFETMGDALDYVNSIAACEGFPAELS